MSHRDAESDDWCSLVNFVKVRFFETDIVRQRVILVTWDDIHLGAVAPASMADS